MLSFIKPKFLNDHELQNSKQHIKRNLKQKKQVCTYIIIFKNMAIGYHTHQSPDPMMNSETLFIAIVSTYRGC